MKWYLKCLKESYADFSGRARRKEYWGFYLFNLLVAFVVGFVLGLIAILVQMPNLAYLAYLYSLIVFIPGLAVSVRRLHDTGHSGWCILLAFIPIVNFVLLYWMWFCNSKPGANEYGENPKGC